MSAALIVAVVCVGVGLEIVGVLFGVSEIKASRRAAIALSQSVTNVYVTGSARLTATVSGSATLTVAPGREEPSQAEKDRRRLDDHEAQIAALRNELAASESRLEELWQRDLKAVAEVTAHTTDDLRTALKTFGADLAAGRWRRYLAVVLLVVGTSLQALAAVAGTLYPPPT